VVESILKLSDNFREFNSCREFLLINHFLSKVVFFDIRIILPSLVLQVFRWLLAALVLED